MSIVLNTFNYSKCSKHSKHSWFSKCSKARTCSLMLSTWLTTSGSNDPHQHDQKFCNCCIILKPTGQAYYLLNLYILTTSTLGLQELKTDIEIKEKSSDFDINNPAILKTAQDCLIFYSEYFVIITNSPVLIYQMLSRKIN